MSIRRLPPDVQLYLVTWAIPPTTVNWARVGLRLGTTSRGLSQLLERRRRVWKEIESDKWAGFDYKRQLQIVRRYFFWLWIEVRVGAARNEIEEQERQVARAQEGLAIDYVIWGVRARGWGVEPTVFGIPETAVAALNL